MVGRIKWDCAKFEIASCATAKPNMDRVLKTFAMSLPWSSWPALMLVLLACALRLVALDHSPPAFYIDEAMGAAHSLSYQQTGLDLFGKIGLFSKSDSSGFYSAPFLLSGAAWSALFGASPVAFRSLVAVIGILSVLGVYRLMSNAAGGAEKALLAAMFAACLPWAFQFSRISWDAPLATCFLIWAVSTAYRTPARMFQVWNCVLAGVLFALASYTYAPMRLNAILLLALLPGLPFRPKVAMFAVFGLLNVPVVPYYLDAEFVSRSQLLSLTSSYPDNPFRDASGPGLLAAYITQLSRHLSLDFLLLRGDSNLRHSVQAFGMLDIVTFFGCLLAFAAWIRGFPPKQEAKHLTWHEAKAYLVSRDTLIFRIGLAGVVAGITPAALTWEGVPHAIRAMGSWPFFVVLAADGWSRVTARWPRAFLAVCVASALCFAFYARNYFFEYPRICGDWFDRKIVERIRLTGEIPDDYGKVAKAYYRVSVKGERCSDIQEELTR